MISVRTQNTLLHSITNHFEMAARNFRELPTPSARALYLEQMRRIMTAAREINPRYPALVARLGGKR